MNIDIERVMRNAHRLCRNQYQWRGVPLWQFVATLAFDNAVPSKTMVPTGVGKMAPAPSANERAAKEICTSYGWDPSSPTNKELPRKAAS